MIWFLFASITACCEALKDLTSKQSLKTVDEYVVIWAFTAVGAIAWSRSCCSPPASPRFGPRYG
ncbi:MAG: EamA family transporter, partial [Synechococcales cyanobacterium RM1_1_8]|nr:EamA family transporter [Synechococcales cyanobacterium RM1_1_8]